MEEFKSINDILDFAIRGEQEAVDFYSGLAGNAKNVEMAEVFRQFAKEEMGHKAHLTRIKDEGIFTHSVENVPDLKIADYLVEVDPSPNMTYQEALIIAMQKEKAAFRLYSDLAAKAPNADIKSIFLGLAQEESKHKLRFEIEYDDFILREN